MGTATRGLRLLRTVAGEDSALERFLRARYRSVFGKKRLRRRSRVGRLQDQAGFVVRRWLGDELRGPGFTLVWSKGADWDRRVGIYLKGACDLTAVFACAPLIRPQLEGVACILEEPGGVSTSRSDVLLQTLEELPARLVDQVCRRLDLPRIVFEPRLFEEDFRLFRYPEAGRFPKTVIVLSTAADIVRTVYRHREEGLLVDPGGWWLNQSVDHVLSDLEAARWFRENFESIGRIDVEAFQDNFARIVKILKDRTGAHILVFNSLVVEPGTFTHSYRFLQNAHAARRREFHLALVELSRTLDFSVVDVDRVLKREGIRTQVDFAHFPPERFLPIAGEVVRILREREVL